MVAQSSEVNNALVLMAAVGALVLFGGRTLLTMLEALTQHLGCLAGPELTVEGVVALAAESAGRAAAAAMPFMVLVGVVGLFASLVQTGVMITPKKLAPDLSHVDPIKGLKNILSLAALMRLLVAVVKITAIGAIAFLVVRGKVHWLYSLAGKNAWQVLSASTGLCFSLITRVVAAMFVVALLDYAYQRWRYEKQLMMTKNELKDEYKRDEGNPEVRARQAQMRRALARSRMMQAVPTADVVVTNPTHIAIALRWSEKEMSAPTVVAKGQNRLAQRIVKVARENGVPVVERRMLAHALYETVEVGMEIPAKLYAAVAEVLAFVFRKGKRA